MVQYPMPSTPGHIISVSPTGFFAGDSISCIGTGFTPNMGINLTIADAAFYWMYGLGSVKTDGSGNFSVKVTTPTSLTYGSWYVYAQEQQSKIILSNYVLVTAMASPPSTSPVITFENDHLSLSKDTMIHVIGSGFTSPNVVVLYGYLTSTGAGYNFTFPATSSNGKIDVKIPIRPSSGSAPAIGQEASVTVYDGDPAKPNIVSSNTAWIIWTNGTSPPAKATKFDAFDVQPRQSIAQQYDGGGYATGLYAYLSVTCRIVDENGAPLDYMTAYQGLRTYFDGNVTNVGYWDKGNGNLQSGTPAQHPYEMLLPPGTHKVQLKFLGYPLPWWANPLSLYLPCESDVITVNVGPTPVSAIQPSIAMSPTSVVAGDTFTITGTGFTPGGHVTWGTFTNDDNSCERLGTTADSSGKITAMSTMKCSASGYAVAVDDSSGQVSPHVPFTLKTAGGINPQVTIDKTSYPQGSIVQYQGTGFTPNSTAFFGITIDNGTLLYGPGSVATDTLGKASGSFLIGTNIPVGPQKIGGYDNTTKTYSKYIQVTVTTPTPCTEGAVQNVVMCSDGVNWQSRDRCVNGQWVHETQTCPAPTGFVVTTDKATYAQGESIHWGVTGATGSYVVPCISTDNAGSVLCSGSSTISSGQASGSFLVGTNVPVGPQKFYVHNDSGVWSSPAQLTITTAPVACTEGATRNVVMCSDGVNWQSRDRCVNGQWVHETQTCPAPTGCTEGAVRNVVMCSDGVTWQSRDRCINNQWVHETQTCPITGPPTWLAAVGLAAAAAIALGAVALIASEREGKPKQA
jgi:hypothetical protein